MEVLTESQRKIDFPKKHFFHKIFLRKLYFFCVFSSILHTFLPKRFWSQNIFCPTRSFFWIKKCLSKIDENTQKSKVFSKQFFRKQIWKITHHFRHSGEVSGQILQYVTFWSLLISRRLCYDFSSFLNDFDHIWALGNNRISILNYLSLGRSL